MTPEQETTPLGPSIIEALATIFAVLFAFVISSWHERRQRQNQKVIEYDVSHAFVLSPETKSPLSVTIDKEFITGQIADKGTTFPVTSAYTFLITAKNVGNETITQPTIEIKLDDSAVIIEPCETNPRPNPQYHITKHRDDTQQNITRLTPAYINSEDTFTISVLSIQNMTPECIISIFGPGIKFRSRGSSITRYEQIKRFAIPAILIIATTCLAISINTPRNATFLGISSAILILTFAVILYAIPFFIYLRKRKF